MWHDSDQLLNISDDFGQLFRPKANDLPQILPRFFVPPLEDRPQNPILEVLDLESITSNLTPRLFQPHLLPQELTALSLNFSQVAQQHEPKVEEFWTNALVRNRGDRVRLILCLFVQSSGQFVTPTEWFIVMGSITTHALN